jgi:hypothetical protein
LQKASFLGSIGATFAHIADKKMETEKDPVKADDKCVYRSPQLTKFGSVANITQVNKNSDDLDNLPSFEMGTKFPPGLS